MAKKQAPKRTPKPLPEAEVAAQSALDTFNKKHEGKTLSDADKAAKKELQKKLGALKFQRIFNKRFPKLLVQMDGISALGAGQYFKSEAQVKAIIGRLRDKVAEVEAKLGGVKQSSNGFQLPGLEELPTKETK